MKNENLQIILQSSVESIEIKVVQKNLTQNQPLSTGTSELSNPSSANFFKGMTPISTLIALEIYSDH